MYFLNQIPAKIAEVTRKTNVQFLINVKEQKDFKSIQDILAVDIYLLIQKAVLAGEYYDDDAEKEISKINRSLLSLDLAQVNINQVIELQLKTKLNEKSGEQVQPRKR